jgi:hypothetical protein
MENSSTCNTRELQFVWTTENVWCIRWCIFTTLLLFSPVNHKSAIFLFLPSSCLVPELYLIMSLHDATPMSIRVVQFNDQSLKLSTKKYSLICRFSCPRKRGNMTDSEQPPVKKRKTESDAAPYNLASLEREITPPKRSNVGIYARQDAPDEQKAPQPQGNRQNHPDLEHDAVLEPSRRRLTLAPSPFQLTRIHELPDSCNVDTITLKDILCDPLIKECWQFNYLFDLDFVMYVMTLNMHTQLIVFIISTST